MHADPATLIPWAREGNVKKIRAWLSRHPPGRSVSAALSEAATHDEVGALKLLLPRASGDEFMLALNTAAFEGSVNVTKALLASDEFKAAEFGSMPLPLQNAIQGGNPKVVKTMLPFLDSSEPIMLALATESPFESESLIELLLPTANPDASDAWALCSAARKNNQQAMRRLASLSNTDLAACALAKNARRQEGFLTGVAPDWDALDRLALCVPAAKAQTWAKDYGAEHFPRWQAAAREDRSLKAPPPSPSARPRYRP